VPIPMEIQHASEEFDRFLADARTLADLTTRNQAYTMVEGVLRTFRRRLEIADALRFADVLPPVLRAIFVARWDVDEPRLPFADRRTMTEEVQSLRKNHNFAPDTCIRAVAIALRRHVDERAFDRVLAGLPAEAAEFWTR